MLSLEFYYVLTCWASNEDASTLSPCTHRHGPIIIFGINYVFISMCATVLTIPKDIYLSILRCFYILPSGVLFQCLYRETYLIECWGPLYVYACRYHFDIKLINFWLLYFAKLGSWLTLLEGEGSVTHSQCHAVIITHILSIAMYMYSSYFNSFLISCHPTPCRTPEGHLREDTAFGRLAGTTAS